MLHARIKDRPITGMQGGTSAMRIRPPRGCPTGIIGRHGAGNAVTWAISQPWEQHQPCPRFPLLCINRDEMQRPGDDALGCQTSLARRSYLLKALVDLQNICGQARR